jgi:hypothetical protein
VMTSRREEGSLDTYCIQVEVSSLVHMLLGLVRVTNRVCAQRGRVNNSRGDTTQGDPGRMERTWLYGTLEGW